MLRAAILATSEEAKPWPKRLHAIVQQRIIALLVRELGLDVALPELALAVLDADGKQIVPDVLVMQPESCFENGVLTSGCSLAVEIMSPKQSFAGMVDKCERMLVSGIVPTCWIIWPEFRAAYTYDHHHGLSQETTKLQFENPITSKSVTLSLVDVVGKLPTERE